MKKSFIFVFVFVCAYSSFLIPYNDDNLRPWPEKAQIMVGKWKTISKKGNRYIVHFTDQVIPDTPKEAEFLIYKTIPQQVKYSCYIILKETKSPGKIYIGLSYSDSKYKAKLRDIQMVRFTSKNSFELADPRSEQRTGSVFTRIQ